MGIYFEVIKITFYFSLKFRYKFLKISYCEGFNNKILLEIFLTPKTFSPTHNSAYNAEFERKFIKGDGVWKFNNRNFPQFIKIKKLDNF